MSGPSRRAMNRTIAPKSSIALSDQISLRSTTRASSARLHLKPLDPNKCLVPLVLEGRQKRNLLGNGTKIDVVGESVNCLQDSFFRAHALSVSPVRLGASPAVRPICDSETGSLGPDDTPI